MYGRYNVFILFFFHENMKKEASKVAHNRPIFFSVLPTFRIQPKSQFLFHKNLPPRDLSILTLVTVEDRMLQINHTVLPCTPCLFQVHFFLVESQHEF